MQSYKWVVSDTLRDRKSVFVGRALAVKSIKEAKEALSALKDEDKKVAKASHSIWACRILASDGHSVAEMEYDDDGEKPAGERLMTFLTQTNTNNVMVLVNRWYGGKQLGGDRFRDIHECAKQALLRGGYLKK